MLGNAQDNRPKRTSARTSLVWIVPAALAAVAFAGLVALQPRRGPDPGSEHTPASAPAIGSELAPARPTEIYAPSDQPVFVPDAPCTAEELEAINIGGDDGVEVRCSLALTGNITITSTLRYTGRAASNTTLTCTCDASGCPLLKGGLTIATNGADRPQNITVRGCTFHGDVRVQNFTSQADTRRSDYEQWVRARAPRRITFDNITIDGDGKDRFYVGGGATEVTLVNSTIKGTSYGVPVYLGPQSSGTLVKNNRFDTETSYIGGREMMTIDSSDYNRIISNWFGGDLSNGAIFLFRNCGEKGDIRHTTPSHNQIINNAFRYDSYDGSTPAIFVGSRNGKSPNFHFPIDIPFTDWGEDYCHLDAGWSFGSSADNRDFATRNVIMQNDIISRPLAKAIQSKNWVNNTLNFIDHNRSVDSSPWPRLPAGCYVRGGDKEFILHGETTEQFIDNAGAPICGRVTCNDGALRSDFTAPQDGVVAPSAGTAGAAGSLDIVAPPGSVVAASEGSTTSCATKRVQIDCQVTGNNNGCRQTVSCPAGARIVGAVAACHLETERVSDALLAIVPPHILYAYQLSDDLGDGSCYVGDNRVAGAWDSYGNITQGAVQKAIRGISGRTSVEAGCEEDDDNGGDCHIRGAVYCR